MSCLPHFQMFFLRLSLNYSHLSLGNMLYTKKTVYCTQIKLFTRGNVFNVHTQQQQQLYLNYKLICLFPSDGWGGGGWEGGGDWVVPKGRRQWSTFSSYFSAKDDSYVLIL